jgi:hypothetical protein
MVSETAPPRPKPDLPKRRAWLRLEGESNDHFELFAAYRDLPASKRTVEQMCRATAIGKTQSLSWLRQLCADYHWVQRAIAFDDFINEQAEREERFTRVASLRRMRAKHREHGDALMGKAIGFLRGEGAKLTCIADALRMAKMGMELQASGHVFDPTVAIVSGDNTEQPTEQTENRRLSIEVFTTGGASMPADDLRSQLAAMYDQRPPSLAAAVINPMEKTQQDDAESSYQGETLDE